MSAVTRLWSISRTRSDPRSLPCSKAFEGMGKHVPSCRDTDDQRASQHYFFIQKDVRVFVLPMS